MKKVIIFLFLFVFTISLSGCSNVNLSQNNSDDLFKKKQECSNYYKRIEDEFKKNESELKDKYYTLKKVFYSKEKNSCLYAYIYKSDTVGHYISWNIADCLTRENYFVSDANSLIEKDNTAYFNKQAQASIEFDNKIKELETK